MNERLLLAEPSMTILAPTKKIASPLAESSIVAGAVNDSVAILRNRPVAMRSIFRLSLRESWGRPSARVEFLVPRALDGMGFPFDDNADGWPWIVALRELDQIDSHGPVFRIVFDDRVSSVYEFRDLGVGLDAQHLGDFGISAHDRQLQQRAVVGPWEPISHDLSDHIDDLLKKLLGRLALRLLVFGTCRQRA